MNNEKFQSTLPARGATTIFAIRHSARKLFQSTLPARGATATAIGQGGQPPNHFNPRSPHGERPEISLDSCLIFDISIHAPRTGSDADGNFVYCIVCEFQSTLPARGATSLWKSWLRSTRFQSTLPARGATRTRPQQSQAGGISIHAPRTGSDRTSMTRSTRWSISIHAPRTGSDCKPVSAESCDLYFNPRSPHGERPIYQQRKNHRLPISIHAPRTGSDYLQYGRSGETAISIHAPRTGSDRACGKAG